MKRIDTHPFVIPHLSVDVSFQDLVQKIKTSGNRPEMLKTAQITFNQVQNIWKPATVYCWVEFQQIQNQSIGRLIQDKCGQNDCGFVDIDFGYSIKFLTHASHALVAVYTAGYALEQESKKASQKGDLLAAFFIDLIGLIVLEKTGNRIKQIAQEKAAKLGWGVSPFLSPGSVHGWNLEEQIKLCSLLPLEKINVEIRDDAVLFPFKTISCLIGVGPGYDAAYVGTTCQVCSKNKDCQMKNKEESKC